MNRYTLEFHDNLGMRLRGAYLSVHRRTDAHFAKFGVTSDQFVVLSLLEEEDGITQQELAVRSYSDANTITAMLRLLERRGWVKREPHATDRRARSVRLTRKGRQLTEQLQQSLNDFHEDLFRTLPEGQEQCIKEWLGRVVEMMARG